MARGDEPWHALLAKSLPSRQEQTPSWSYAINKQ
jgi:hypothetical protein